MRTVRIVLALVIALSVAAAVVAQEKPKEKGKAARLSPTLSEGARPMFSGFRTSRMRGSLKLAAISPVRSDEPSSTMMNSKSPQDWPRMD